MEKKSDKEYDAQSSFRVEQELKDAVIDFAKGFDMDESWGWRMLTTFGLGDAAPELMKKKFAKFRGMI